MNDSFLRLEEKICAIPHWVWIAIIAIALLFVVRKWIGRYKRNNSKDAQKAGALNFGEKGYGDEILKSLPEDARLDFNHFYNKLNELQHSIDKYQSALDLQKTEAANDLNRRIAESQLQIERRWKSLEKKGNFYHYICLHYASFTLADSIKREQEILRSAFVQAKNKCDILSEEIRRLNQEIPNAHGARRYELMQRHKQLCEQHKRTSKLKGIFGSRNTQYLNMVKVQNKKTSWYREYIIHNCGARGRAWGKRLKKRRMDQII